MSTNEGSSGPSQLLCEPTLLDACSTLTSNWQAGLCLQQGKHCEGVALIVGVGDGDAT